jgi:hypothetical protein
LRLTDFLTSPSFEEADPMPSSRVAAIAALEKLRNSKVVTLITSVRPNVAAQMSDDQVRVLYDHIIRLRGKQTQKLPALDLYIVSNGGDGIVPWRIISVFREFAKKVGVLVPYRAYSAATLTALGADEIIMGPFAQLGPIDPTVQNDYNPVDERTHQRIGVSVEDVKSFVQFIKTTVGITHEDELIRAVEALLQKVHPLALGNVERFITQSRMSARKLLRTHMSEDSDKHLIDDIIEDMASKLYFHGHPISRVEAHQDLHLKVASDVSRELDDALWTLYLHYEELFEMTSIFNPGAALAALRIAEEQAKRAEYDTAFSEMLTQNIPRFQAHQMTVQMMRERFGPVAYEAETTLAAVESSQLSSICTIRQRWESLPDVQPGQPPQVRHDVLDVGWHHAATDQSPPASIKSKT